MNVKDLSILDILPSEILKVVLINLDIESLSIWFKINRSTILYREEELDNILRSKIVLDSYKDTKDMNRKQLIILVEIIEKGEYYGKFFNDKVWMFNRNNDFNGALDKKYLKKGKCLDNITCIELIDILWSMHKNPGLIIDSNYKESIAQEILVYKFNSTNHRFVFPGNNFTLQEYDYDHIIKWDLNKLAFFNGWLKLNPDKYSLCKLVKDRMIELNIV